MGDGAEEEALVDLLGYPGYEQEKDDEEDVGGNAEEVSFEGTEAGGFESQGEVLLVDTHVSTKLLYGPNEGEGGKGDG